MDKKDRMLVPNTFGNFSLFDEDFWDVDTARLTGLSVYEDKSNVFVEADLPGLKPEDIEITLERGTLWIHGERKEEKKDEKKKYYRKASSSFSYRILVPGVIDEKKEPEATYKEGVMKIRFAKSSENQVKKININKK